MSSISNTSAAPRLCIKSIEYFGKRCPCIINEFVDILALTEKGKSVERRRRKATDLRDTRPMTAGLPGIKNRRLHTVVLSPFLGILCNLPLVSVDRAITGDGYCAPHSGLPATTELCRYDELEVCCASCAHVAIGAPMAASVSAFNSACRRRISRNIVTVS